VSQAAWRKRARAGSSSPWPRKVRALRKALGEGPEISVFSGHMAGDTDAIRDARLTPMLNSAEQLARHRDTLPECALRHPARQRHEPPGDGARRLGRPARAGAEAGPITLVMSHLACADEPDHPANAAQLKAFREMTAGARAPRSLAATGGILLGPDYHFDLTRPGIGLYGGLPFTEATPVVRLSLPVIQTRDLAPGETVGYGCTFTATRPTKIATVSAGYADGLIRAASNRATLWAGDTPCPLAGRVSMDLLTVDVTELDTVPDTLDILGPHQTVDTLADAAGTIGYESSPPSAPATAAPRPRHDRPPHRAARRRGPLGPRPSRRNGPRHALLPHALSHILRPPWYPRELAHQLLHIGWLSLPVVGLTALFTGGALALQIFAGGSRFNAEAVVPRSSPSASRGNLDPSWAVSWWQAASPLPSPPRSAP
jgi:alanine racemase